VLPIYHVDCQGGDLKQSPSAIINFYINITQLQEGILLSEYVTFILSYPSINVNKI